MPRKPIIYTHEFPYHLSARCNNGNCFSLPKDEVWEIYCAKLLHISDNYGFQVHAFTLMTNHSHLIATPSEEHYLGEAMNVLQTSVAREINRKSGQSDHVFGGPYSPSLITNPFYFAHAKRYIFQNPIRAGITRTVQDYKFSTVHDEMGIQTQSMTRIKIVTPTNGIDHLLDAMDSNERLNWYNELLERPDAEFIRNGLKRRSFKIARPQGEKKPNWLTKSLKK
jgi:REP element-mobilizing transposase RayT